MRVVVTKAQLEDNRACPVYLNSPNWTGEELVYEDWSESVKRFLSTRDGTVRLNFLVQHGLVPMTVSEFVAARNATQRGDKS